MYLAQLVLALCEAEIDEDMGHGKKCKKKISSKQNPHKIENKQANKNPSNQPTESFCSTEFWNLKPVSYL